MVAKKRAARVARETVLHLKQAATDSNQNQQIKPVTPSPSKISKTINTLKKQGLINYTSQYATYPQFTLNFL
jgi:hypothetical protein